VISPERPAWGAGPRLCPSPTPSHTPDRGGYHLGVGAGEGAPPPPPPSRTTLTLPKGSRAGSGFSWREPGKGVAGVPAQIVRFAGISPYTLLPSPPPRPRLRRSSPSPMGGRSAGDIPRKAGPGAGPDYALPPHHPMHRTEGDIAWGRGPGRGTPLPADKNHIDPPKRLPRRIGGSRGESPGRVWPGCRPRMCVLPASRHTLLSFLPHPARASRSSPTEDAGSAGDIPRKAGLGSRPPTMPFPHTIPYTGPRGISSGGGELSSPAKRTILALPQGSRAGAGVLVTRAREDPHEETSPECAFSRHHPMHSSPLSPTPPAPSALLPRPWAGAVQVISPERPARGGSPEYALSPASSHTPDRGGYQLGVGAGEGIAPLRR